MAYPYEQSRLAAEWESDERWAGIERPYGAEDVLKLRGSMQIEYTLADHGSRRLWDLLKREPYVTALGAVTGHQAVQQVGADLKAIYVSGRQAAGDNNSIGQIYPDRGLYPANSVPNLVRRVNNALRRADQIQALEGRQGTRWFVPVIADAEAGFGGFLNAFELMKAMIEAGAAGVHFEDQLPSKKSGYAFSKVLVPTSEAIKKLIAARLAADVCEVPTILIARTDAISASLLSRDADPRDYAFMSGSRNAEGFFNIRNGIEPAIARALSYAPFCDMLWCETDEPNLDDARRIAEEVHSVYAGKLLAYNCPASFNWSRKFDAATIAKFQRELGAYGYKFQFVSLAGFHSLNASMFDLAAGYAKEGMSALSRFQEREFESESAGYGAVKSATFVGSSYFEHVKLIVSGEELSMKALKDTGEEQQFEFARMPQPL